MDQKIALVTGANKGLGLEISRQLAQQGTKVYMGARDSERGQAAAQTLKAEGLDVHFMQLDVENDEQIASAAAKLEAEHGRLDILVNNAGVNFDGTTPTREAFRKTFEINVTSPFMITQAMLPLLQKSKAGRIVNHSSILGSLDTIGKPNVVSADWLPPAYNSSKSALNMLTVIQGRHLEGTKIKVNSAHPGWVKTDLGGQEAPMELVDGAKTAVMLANLPDDGPTGGYFHLGEPIAW
ncbi:MAG: SDR family oxidoreductase [Armatimonadetes bacterium]|nr:SDR family oxidoreductase [Armatimonadota bacterium]